MQENYRLESISLFSALSPAQLDLIGGALERHSYRAGEDIFVQGSPAEGILIVLSGEGSALPHRRRWQPNAAGDHFS